MIDEWILKRAAEIAEKVIPFEDKEYPAWRAAAVKYATEIIGGQMQAVSDQKDLLDRDWEGVGRLVKALGFIGFLDELSMVERAPNDEPYRVAVAALVIRMEAAGG